MYVKKDDKKIPDGLKQCWLFEISVNGTSSAKRLVELKNKRVILDLDIEILKFLYQYEACPVEYIAKAMGYENLDPIKERLDKLVAQHIINIFMLTDGAEIKYKQDAKAFYCLDSGGVTLLRYFGDDADSLDFKLEDLIMNSTKLNKRLMAMDFYFQLKETIGNKLTLYKVNPILSCGGSKYSPKAFFTIDDGDNKKAYLLEISRYEDSYEGESLRFSEKLSKCDAIVNTNAWKKYFNGKKPPTLLVLCENDEDALNKAQLIETSGLIQSSRICTIESLKNGLETAFIKYEDEKLKPVKTKSFAKVSKSE